MGLTIDAIKYFSLLKVNLMAVNLIQNAPRVNFQHNAKHCSHVFFNIVQHLSYVYLQHRARAISMM